MLHWDPQLPVIFTMQLLSLKKSDNIFNNKVLNTPLPFAGPFKFLRQRKTYIMSELSCGSKRQAKHLTTVWHSWMELETQKPCKNSYLLNNNWNNVSGFCSTDLYFNNQATFETCSKNNFFVLRGGGNSLGKIIVEIQDKQVQDKQQ